MLKHEPKAKTSLQKDSCSLIFRKVHHILVFAHLSVSLQPICFRRQASFSLCLQQHLMQPSLSKSSHRILFFFSASVIVDGFVGKGLLRGSLTSQTIPISIRKCTFLSPNTPHCTLSGVTVPTFHVSAVQSQSSPPTDPSSSFQDKIAIPCSMARATVYIHSGNSRSPHVVDNGDESAPILSASG